jgi:hypothetical protein
MDIGNEAYLGLAKQILEETCLAFLHKSDLHRHPAYIQHLFSTDITIKCVKASGMNTGLDSVQQ